MNLARKCTHQFIIIIVILEMIMQNERLIINKGMLKEIQIITIKRKNEKKKRQICYASKSSEYISTNILCSNYIFTYIIQHYIYRVNDMSLEGFRNEQMILQVILCF